MTLIAGGAAAVAILMLILWIIHLRIHNAAIIDAGWAGGLAILGVIDGALGSGWLQRRSWIAVVTGVWGMRLALHLLRDRVIGHPEEGRYVDLRRKWGTNQAAKFLIFFEFQALLCVLLSLPFYLAASNPDPGFHALEILGLVIWASAIAGEALADQQLAAFKRNPSNRGRTCREGLWRYSRHPNYFFEWLIWLGFALMALPANHGWIGLLSPALILYFLLFVTGIPPTEAQAVRSRGGEYRDYQRTTSAFVPWFPKRQRAVPIEFPKARR